MTRVHTCFLHWELSSEQNLTIIIIIMVGRLDRSIEKGLKI